MIRKATIAVLVILGTPTGLLLAYDVVLLRSTSTPITLYDLWVCLGAAILIVLLGAWGLFILLRGQFSRRRKLKCVALTFSVSFFLVWQVSLIFELGHKWPGGAWVSLADGCLETGLERLATKYTWTTMRMQDYPLFVFWGRAEWWPRTWSYRSGMWKAIRIPLWMVYLPTVITTIVIFWRNRRLPPGHCQYCSYDLTGNVSGVCPECGTKVDQP